MSAQQKVTALLPPSFAQAMGLVRHDVLHVLPPPRQAMGLLFIPRPDLMLAEPAVMPLMEGALEPCSSTSGTGGMSGCSDHEGVKRRVLGNLVELLRAEEEGMAERQAQVGERGGVVSPLPAFTLHNSHIPHLPFQVNEEHAACTQASILPSSSCHLRSHLRSTHFMFQVNEEHAACTQASILPSSSSASAHRPLALVNGEGDASSVTGSVVQRLWGRVLALARDVPPPPPAAEGRAGTGAGAEEEPPTPLAASGGGDDGRIVRR